VIGNAGGGKSTMSRELCMLYKLPYFELDKIQWQPGYLQTPAKKYNEAHQSLIAGKRWLVDGYGSWSSVLERMDAADTIIVIDHHILIHYWWATKRQFKSLFNNGEVQPGNSPPWRLTLKLYKMIWQLHRTQRSKLIDEVEQRSNIKRYIHIQSPSALKHFLKTPV